MAVDLGPGYAVARSMLGRLGDKPNLECLEHLGSRRRAARETLHQEAALPAACLGQLKCQPPELGGERVVDEQNVHHHPPLAAATEENSSASLGRHTSWLHSTRKLSRQPHRPSAGRMRDQPELRAPAFASASSSRSSTSRPVWPSVKTSRCRLSIRSKHHAAGGHRLEQRSLHGIGPARGDMQVARGEDFRDDRWHLRVPGTRARLGV